MKKVVVFSEEEFNKIREYIVDMEDDIWDLLESEDRALMQSDMNKLKELLGLF